MSKILIFLFAILVISHSKSVIELTDENFDELTRNGKWLLEFFAPWCPHCQTLEPILEETAKVLKTHYPEFKIGSIDCTVQKSLAAKYGVEAYPTIKILRDGYVTDYHGGRESKDFIQFAKKATGPSVTNIQTIEQFKTLKKDNPVIFLVKSEDNEILKLFEKLSKKHQDHLTFASTQISSIMKELTNDESGIAWISDSIETYKGNHNEVELEKWILERKFPIFVEINGFVWRELEEKGKKMVISAVYPEKKDDKRFNEMIQNIALKNKKFSFGWLNANDYSKFISKFLDLSDLPHIFVMEAKKFQYWSNSSIERNEDSLNNFLDKIDNNLIEPRNAGGILNSIVYTVRDWIIILYENPVYGAVMALAIVILFGATIALIFCTSDQDDVKEKAEQKE